MLSTEAKHKVTTSVVVGILQHPETRKILISKRTEHQHLAGLWEFPGGKVESGEDLFHALQREMIEEVGINIQAAYPLKLITHHYDDKPVCLNFWFVTHFEGEGLSQEGQEVKWVELSELSQYQFPEANNNIIKSLNLPSFLMVTPDCEYSKIDEFVQTIKISIERNNLKQILFRSKHLNDEDYYGVYNHLKVEVDKLQCLVLLNRSSINEELAINWHLTSTQLFEYKKRPSSLGLLSASCHTIEDLIQAEKLDLDFVLLSAVKATNSHPNGTTLGWHQFKMLAHETALPVYALGGVCREDIALARLHGAIGVAGISTFIARSELT